MNSKKFFAVLFLTILVVYLIFSVSFATTTPRAEDNGVTLYADYGDGFEYLTTLYFEKGVTETSYTIDEPITMIRVVKGECYELDLDRLTLNGVCPEGFECKLSATDNDLLEVEDYLDFELEGSGELVISARAPISLLGERYSFKFPRTNLGEFETTSNFYQYELGTNLGSFDEEDLQIPSEDYLFMSQMCYPDSGHPDAPIDFYLANDDENLYVLFEAFVDNTFDDGKDFAGVHVKCGDEVKTYKVHTTDENEYGRWWFEYTDSSDEYDYQHMSYIVEIPLSEIENENGVIDLAFEYYGTAAAQEPLMWLAVGEVYYVDQEVWQHEYDNYLQYDYITTFRYDDPNVRILPEAGVTNNAESGDTAEGEWWLTNVGTEQKDKYVLTLNGATITNVNNKFCNYAYLRAFGSLTVELVEGTDNVIGTEGTDVIFGIDGDGSLDFVIQGEGTLTVYGAAAAINSYTETNFTFCDGAVVNAIVDNTSSDYTDPTIGVAEYYKDEFLTIDNAILNVTRNSSRAPITGIRMGGKIALKNNAILEITTSGGTLPFAIGIRESGDLICNYEDAVLLEGDSADDAEEVEELTNTHAYSSVYGTEFITKPYIKISQGSFEDEKVMVTVSFDPNGGSGEMKDVEVEDGSTYTLPSCSFKAPSGKTFDKWDLGKKGAKITISGDTTLVAQWKKKSTSSGGGASVPSTYKVTTKTNSEHVKIEPQNPTVKRNGSQEFTFTPDEGYEIEDVLVDGKSVGAVNKYTIEKVNKKHTIEVKVKEKKESPWSKVDEWAEEEMKKANDGKLIPETFAKKDFTKAISRSEFAAVAVKLYEALSGNEAELPKENPFEDTKDEYVLKAYNLGITVGISKTEFGNGPVTREQMATMLCRALDRAGIKVEDVVDTFERFTDDKEMSEWAKLFVYFMAEKDIIKGVGGKKFDPQGKSKIEEALAISLRCVETFKK